MRQPRLRRSRALAFGAVALGVAIGSALLVVWLAAASFATTPLTAGLVVVPAVRAAPAEHMAAAPGAIHSRSQAAQHGAAPKGGCQVSVTVSQTSSGGSSQQSSSVSTSSSGGSCSTCVVSVQSSQSSANGANTNVNSTTQSCAATGSGVHITQGGTSISITSGGTHITISRNGQVSITVR